MAKPKPVYRDYRLILKKAGVKTQASNCSAVCLCIVRPFYMDEIERENAGKKEEKAAGKKT